MTVWRKVSSSFVPEQFSFQKKEAGLLNFFSMLLLELLPFGVVSRLCKHLEPDEVELCAESSKELEPFFLDESIWIELSNRSCRSVTCGSLTPSPWKLIYLILTFTQRQYQNMIWCDPQELFSFFSGNKCSNHNHPVFFLTPRGFTILGQMVELEFPKEELEVAWLIYLVVLSLKSYHPKFEDSDRIPLEAIKSFLSRD